MTVRNILLVTLIACQMMLSCDIGTESVDACGDGFLDPGEECDNDIFTVGSCTELGYYQQTETLRCKQDCTIDTIVCVGGRCGDGIVQHIHGELCDGVPEMSCAELGLGGGQLSCSSTCRFDSSGCEKSAICGDGEVAYPYEFCDGADLYGNTCESIGFIGGFLSCNNDCKYDTSNCLGTTSYSISVAPQLDVWTPSFNYLSSCNCEEATPQCNALYQGKIVNLDGNIVTLNFRKLQGDPPASNIPYWIVIGGELYPHCSLLSAYISRQEGTWASSASVLEESTRIWAHD